MTNALLATILFGAMSGAASADPDQRTTFDIRDGADRAHYPPDCPVDFQHMKLELLFDDLTSKSFDGTATFVMQPVHENVRQLILNAVDFVIVDVRSDAPGGVRYDYDGRELTLLFDQPLPADTDTTIHVKYRCIQPAYGMIWALPDDAYPNRPLVIHTQGEPEYARHWFPCIDSPVDRSTTEIIVDIPSPFIAISNGRLVDRQDNPTTGRSTFHYRQEQPHVVYLVSLIIGKFNEVKDSWRDIPLQYFLPEGKGESAKLTYGRTPEMMEHFSNILGYAYPYAKYAQTNVPLFMFGGMENTSATTMTDTAILTPRACIDQDLEGLISHELAHQWFGDLITCRSWEHIWLNEGFATFMASVWKEKSKGRDEYLYEFWKRYSQVVGADLAATGEGVLWQEYRHPFEVFRHKGSMPYSKGSCALHMLRHQLGETLFWRSIREYVHAYAYSEVETDDLRRVIEKVTGRNLERFFTQWLVRPGVVHLDVTYQWDAANKRAEVSITQTQPIDDDRPAFVAPLDLYFRTGNAEHRVTLKLDLRTHTYTREFASKPDLFCVDPRAGLLMKLTCTKPREMWLTQLREGPTSISRINAAKHLTRDNRPEIVEALHVAASNRDEGWTVRAEAAAALGAIRSNRARDALVRLLGDGDAVADPRIRAAVIQAAGTYDDPSVGEAIAPFAVSDASSLVESIASHALGNIPSFDAEDTLVANADKESYSHKIRTASIAALADRNDPKAMDVALKYAAYGRHDRVRVVAIRALGRLAKKNPAQRQLLRDAVARYLTDPQKRPVMAAVQALGDIGDAESVTTLRKFLAGSAADRIRIAAEDALTLAETKARQDGELDVLRDTVDDLRRSISSLQERMAGVEQKAERGGR